ncbi:MAG TPA: hypothetical protein G4O16_10470 [Dehalococcoidia bacterium]|nr:hypothetical protein [Dehalococcoidia bacterium]
MKLKGIAVIVTVLVITLADACEKTPEKSTTLVVPPITGGEMELVLPGEMVTYHLGIAPGTPGAANDDIVYPPGGPTYRAKVHEMDKPEWPAVPEVEKTIDALGGTIQCQYREYIETKAGEIRNNILYLFGEDTPGLSDPRDIEYYVEGLHAGIGIILGSHGYGGIAGQDKQSSKVIFQIDIAPQINPGVYAFNIVLMYEDEVIARFPCTINVKE